MSMRLQTDLSKFDNSWYKPGGSPVKRLLWYVVNAIFLNSAFPLSGLKCSLLRAFGARIGKGVVIKPHVNVKYPWRLQIGNHVWIGEKVWIDNLGNVIIKDHACISQGAMLLCGNHNYKREAFDLMVGDITLHEGAWVGAQTVVCPGVEIGSHAILTVGSVATHYLEPYFIYQGNPAVKGKERVFKNPVK